ncbi:unnamed protein product [Blepharisma stoltei]|uniref:cGMP-dependent protein kinase n=1 Tax=Blepharisma stoltei TaxID=1481888 RepID=A0AAU9JPQ1_9CILI|nr:unnamed protein product [Blepharisma stoltei]
MDSVNTKFSSSDEESIAQEIHAVEETRFSRQKSKSCISRSTVKNRTAIIDERVGSYLSIDAPNALIEEIPMSGQEKDIVYSAINKNFLFRNLPEESYNLFFSQMKKYTLDALEIVFEQSHPGRNFFIITSGRIEVLSNQKQVNILTVGDSFGELALLHDSLRSASVKTLERVTMWSLERNVFRKIVKIINDQNYEENLQFIETIPIFQTLTKLQIEALAYSLSSMTFKAGEKIVNEGDLGDLFYIIKDGSVYCLEEGREIKIMAKGEFFGEQALIYNNERTASIVAIDNVKCVGIGREKLSKVLGNHLEHIIYQNSIMIALERSSILRLLKKDQLLRIADAIHISKCLPGEIIIPKNTRKGLFIFIVLNGSLIDENGSIIAKKFCIIGDKEIRLSEQENINEDIISSNDLIIGTISKQEFEDCIGGPLDQVLIMNEATSCLKRVNIFRCLSDDKLQLLVRELSVQEYFHQEIIVEQNSSGDSIFIIRSGTVDVFKDGVRTRSITLYDYFGERSVLFDEVRTATVIANGPVSCWVLSKESFLNVIDAMIREQLVKRIELQDNNISLSELAIVKLLGRGRFGIVHLVVHKDNKRLYMLKSINRKKIEEYHIQENLILERNILLQMDHPNVIKLVKTFKDIKRIYFLMEYVRGMDFFDVIRRMNEVTEQNSQFFVASLLTNLEYIHERSIVYRDLRPENIMIDEDGYTKLTNFGLAKILNGRTYSIVGAPHYIAPEVIVGKGYSYAVDIWSLGIILYELICGGVPFGDSEDDPYCIYEAVLQRNLTFPNFISNRTAEKAVIAQLLSEDPLARTGGSIEKLKQHSWFNNFSWDDLMNRKLEVPFKPKVLDLSREINKSLMRNSEIDNIITIEEEKARPTKLKCRKKKDAQVNWDIEF